MTFKCMKREQLIGLIHTYELFFRDIVTIIARVVDDGRNLVDIARLEEKTAHPW